MELMKHKPKTYKPIVEKGKKTSISKFNSDVAPFFLGVTQQALALPEKEEPSSSKKSGFDKHKRSKINTIAVPSTLTTMAATPSVAPPTPTQEITTKIYVTPLSPATTEPCSSNTITLSTPPMAPRTPVPKVYDWTHSKITPKGRHDFLYWAICTGRSMADPDECRRFIKWAKAKSEIAAVPDLEEGGKRRFVNWSKSVSRKADPNEPRRKVLKWPHSTSTIRAPDERKRWSLQEEISKPFETALKCLQDSYTDLKQEHMIYTCKKGMHGVYECQNALWIWPTLRDIWVDGGPREVGKKIKEKFPESDMIEGSPSINDFGYVTVKLSGKWVAESIHKMLEAGIDTWAPKLPVERVIIASPSLREADLVDVCRRSAIRDTLMSILEYSKVDVTISRPTITPARSEMDWAKEVLNRCFSTEERQDMTQDDFDNAYKDLLALWNGLQSANWMIYLTPVWKQEYIEMCFSAAKFKEHAQSNRHKSARTSYAGYRSCSIHHDYSLFERARAHVAVEQAEDAKLLGYTPKAVVDCVLKYTCLKTHRLAECKLNINDEIFKEEGNTFLYLLNTQAKIRRITDDYREDINELKKASELILGNVEGWEEGEERMLGCRLLEFTEALEESCLSVLPHILCEYLYDLSNKFNRFYFCVCKAGSVTDTSSLLLCQATALVMEKSFHLLGISPKSSVLSDEPYGPMLHTLLTTSPRRMDVYARGPRRNSRFELFSFLTYTATDLESDKMGKVFGDISVSDKYGLLSSDGESYFFEPEYAHVPLFNHKWCDPITPTRSGLVYLGNPSSGCSVSVSSSIEVRMELYVAKDEEDECYQISNHKIEIDFSDLWEKESDSACGDLTVSGDEGSTSLFYVILKDAVVASLEVKFETKTPGREVCGYVLAYYGDDFLAECQCLPSRKYHYMSLLFLPNHDLKVGAIQLLKSILAVPTNGSLVIKAYLEDVKSGEVIMKNSCKFKSQHSGCSFSTISGTDCQFDLKVDWKYQTQ